MKALEAGLLSRPADTRQQNGRSILDHLSLVKQAMQAKAGK
jgi:hypothetical protein